MHFQPNLAEIQPENHQNVQKTHFLQKAPGVNGLKLITGCQTEKFGRKVRNKGIKSGIRAQSQKYGHEIRNTGMKSPEEIKVTVYLQIDNFLQISIFRLK